MLSCSYLVVRMHRRGLKLYDIMNGLLPIHLRFYYHDLNTVTTLLMMSYLQCHSILFCSVAFYSFLSYSILYPVSITGFEESPNGFGRNGLSSNGTVLTDDGIGASRGHKVGRTRGVKGAKKVLAVAAADRFCFDNSV